MDVLLRGWNMSKNRNAPYKPSWVDRFTNWISGLPGPGWVYYLGLGALLIIIQSLAFWIEKALPIGAFNPVQIFLVLAIAFMLGIIPYFDDQARKSLKTIKPSLNIEQDEYTKLEFQITNLPASKAIYSSILALLFLFSTEYMGGGPYQFEEMAGYPLSASLSRGTYVVCWWFFGVFIYHAIHHLGLINRIYSHHTLVDLFRMKPLYGLSNLAALTAGSLIMLPYGFLYINPDVQLTDPIVLITYLIISSIPLIIFFWPQLGIHNLQKQERGRLLNEAYNRYQKAVNNLHQHVDEENYKEMANISMAFGSLDMEIRTIKRVSTCPWQPEALRWLLTALILPLLMWLTQYFLGKLL